MSAATIAQALGNARRDGKDWRCRCPVCGSDNLTLFDSGRRLLVRCFSGCGSREIHAELRRRNLRNRIGDGNGSAKPETRTEHETKAATAAARRKIRIDGALDIWRNSLPAADTMCETYLSSRLLIGPVPPALRYVPALWHKEARVRYPALIGLVQHQIKGLVGIHVIYLNPLDAAARSTAEPRKISLGVVSGGAVRLAAAGTTLAVAEGIEDALAFNNDTGVPAWAAITADGIRSFIPPPLETTDTIILIEDQDKNGTGQRAVADAARRLVKKGYQVKLARPIIGKDVNEALLKLGLNRTLCTLENYAQGGSAGGWYSKCLTGRDGRTLSNLSNTLLALREDPTWKAMFIGDALFGIALIHPKALNRQTEGVAR